MHSKWKQKSNLTNNIEVDFKKVQMISFLNKLIIEFKNDFNMVIIFQNILYWCYVNNLQNKKNIFQLNKYNITNCYTTPVKMDFFMDDIAVKLTKRQILYAFTKLKEQGYIKSKNNNLYGLCQYCITEKSKKLLTHNDINFIVKFGNMRNKYVLDTSTDTDNLSGNFNWIE